MALINETTFFSAKDQQPPCRQISTLRFPPFLFTARWVATSAYGCSGCFWTCQFMAILTKEKWRKTTAIFWHSWYLLEDLEKCFTGNSICTVLQRNVNFDFFFKSRRFKDRLTMFLFLNSGSFHEEDYNTDSYFLCVSDDMKKLSYFPHLNTVKRMVLEYCHFRFESIRRRPSCT